MPNKFSDYRNSNLDELFNKNKDILNEFKNQNYQTFNNLNNLINQYSSMPSDMLFNEFLKVAEEKKRNGTLNFEYLNNLRQVLYPYLNAEQKQIFENLFNMIR